MPFLRVIRDKRGYETTYLMHWYREGSRQRTRVLYVFRTPGGVRVGREALEPDILKDLERQHPDIAFDWSGVFRDRQVVEASIEPRRPRKRAPETPADSAPVPAVAPPAAPAPLHPPVPARVEGDTPDEQVAFLARWYVVVRERITQRVSDPERQEILLALAERLNPANWTDADQMTAGLAQAAEALERLARVFAKRRRRSKKRVGAPARVGGGEATAPSGPEEATDDGEAADDGSGSSPDA